MPVVLFFLGLIHWIGKGGECQEVQSDQNCRHYKKGGLHATMRVSLLVVTLIIGLAVAGAAAETIKIGALMSLTGALGPYGPAIANGAQLAVDQINAAGGVLGKQLELIIRDDATSPDIGRDAATKLVELDKVTAIVGALRAG